MIKLNFYISLLLKSLLLPSIYIYFISNKTLPELFEIILNIEDNLLNLVLYFRQLQDWDLIMSFYIINVLIVLILTDFTYYISDLYEMDVTFDIKTLNKKSNKFNKFRSGYKGKIKEYDDSVIMPKMKEVDKRLNKYLDLRHRNIFSNPEERTKLKATSMLPFSIRKVSKLWHHYRIINSESIMEYDKINGSKLNLFSYIKFHKSVDINILDFRINMGRGIMNRGMHLLAPIYEQIIMEEMNSRGDKFVVANLTCFAPFHFFPSIRIDEVLFCYEIGGLYYPISYGTFTRK